MNGSRLRGFTLIELLVVMAIIAMLAALVGPTLFDKLGGSKQKAAAAQLSMIESALDSYRLDVGKYPRNLEDLNEDSGSNPAWAGPYLKKGIPLDPWGNKYEYQQPGKHNRKGYDLYSFGADGRDGGTNEDKDVVNW
ncbi:MAG: type II secretion system major pseudopilin GspG [Gammaproteobacteria bacterium]|nr:type II secretion system major pseudopilin GspG [Gammaproteobacteria bacterium]MCP5407555.1 type II secretion system major pseudopilin GspG [Chromatiaceae bacterium]MCP5441829.1 type II secretion system major pseudopilin GspG [Chromatiaceae bacterium]